MSSYDEENDRQKREVVEFYAVNMPCQCGRGIMIARRLNASIYCNSEENVTTGAEKIEPVTHVCSVCGKTENFWRLYPYLEPFSPEIEEQEDKWNISYIACNCGKWVVYRTDKDGGLTIFHLEGQYPVCFNGDWTAGIKPHTILSDVAVIAYRAAADGALVEKDDSFYIELRDKVGMKGKCNEK